MSHEIPLVQDRLFAVRSLLSLLSGFMEEQTHQEMDKSHYSDLENDCHRAICCAQREFDHALYHIPTEILDLEAPGSWPTPQEPQVETPAAQSEEPQIIELKHQITEVGREVTALEEKIFILEEEVSKFFHKAGAV
jgi:hypothetical protein